MPPPLFVGSVDNIRQDHYAVGTALQVGRDSIVEVVGRNQSSAGVSLPNFQHARERVG
jgi:hypothetical protein